MGYRGDATKKVKEKVRHEFINLQESYLQDGLFGWAKSGRQIERVFSDVHFHLGRDSLAT
jgi:hypothetical protein